jgi:putative Mg2+ transporter-C (MgtC) family protein
VEEVAIARSLRAKAGRLSTIGPVAPAIRDAPVRSQGIVRRARPRYPDGMGPWNLPEMWHALDVAGRLALAAALGAVLGIEREAKGKAAGLRTHMLVALGAALFTVSVVELGASSEALARVVQGLAAGIGFVGGGAILKEPNAQHVHGLTTAAGIWLTAAVGLVVAMGRPWIGVFATLLALAITALLGRLVGSTSHEGGTGA